MRICSFNVENFFQRPRTMNQATWSVGRPVLAACRAQHPARLNPHVLGVVEAENRVVLKHFTEAQLRTAAARHDVPLFPHVMLIDGNDDRGIDVALLTKATDAASDHAAIYADVSLT